jgi:hypothetical protein
MNIQIQVVNILIKRLNICYMKLGSLNATKVIQCGHRTNGYENGKVTDKRTDLELELTISTN